MFYPSMYNGDNNYSMNCSPSVVNKDWNSISLEQQQQSNNPTPMRKSKKDKSVDIEGEILSQNLYKTELCRSFTETQACKYGSKCQFAHGKDELRPLLRHPKYKTELCKTYFTTGDCPYGKRCRFIHTKNPELANYQNHKIITQKPSTVITTNGTSVTLHSNFGVQKPLNNLDEINNNFDSRNENINDFTISASPQPSSSSKTINNGYSVNPELIQLPHPSGGYFESKKQIQSLGNFLGDVNDYVGSNNEEVVHFDASFEDESDQEDLLEEVKRLSFFQTLT